MPGESGLPTDADGTPEYSKLDLLTQYSLHKRYIVAPSSPYIEGKRTRFVNSSERETQPRQTEPPHQQAEEQTKDVKHVTGDNETLGLEEMHVEIHSGPPCPASKWTRSLVPAAREEERSVGRLLAAAVCAAPAAGNI